MKTEIVVKLRALIRDTDCFAEKLDLLHQAGLSKGAAIMFAWRHNPSGYNVYARRRQNRGVAELQTL
jgi:hypothetical protein